MQLPLGWATPRPLHVIVFEYWQKSPTPSAGSVQPVQVAVVAVSSSVSRLTVPSPAHVLALENSEQVGPSPVSGPAQVHFSEALS